MALYTAKCFWPGVTEDELRLATSRASSQTADPQTVFRGALYVPTDELVLCLFESTSKPPVKLTSEKAGLPCERVIESLWIAPNRATKKELQ